MSSDPQSTLSNSEASRVQGNGLNGLQALEAALTGVNSVLGREGEELSERDLARLLKELEAADGVADDVEGKLDELLKNLGGMLDGLEAGQQGSETKTGTEATLGEKKP